MKQHYWASQDTRQLNNICERQLNKRLESLEENLKYIDLESKVVMFTHYKAQNNKLINTLYHDLQEIDQLLEQVDNLDSKSISMLFDEIDYKMYLLEEKEAKAFNLITGRQIQTF